MRALLHKYKEMILYLICGGMAFVLSVALFAFFHITMRINELTANILSWVITVVFAFYTNKYIVFEDHGQTGKTFWEQFLSFTGGRLVTLGAEEVILFVFITWLAFASVPVKIFAQIVVIVLNYIISKWYVFAKEKTEKER